jgi:hypothetical protein
MSQDNELLFQETGAWDQAELRRRNDLTIKPYFGYNVVENASRTRGVYRPIRNLPVRYRRGNRDDFEGFVFSQGKILMTYDARIYNGTTWSYQNDPKKLGVKNTVDNPPNDLAGEFFAFKRADGSLQKSPFNSPYWGYSEDIQGFLAEANGTDVNVQEYFGTLDTLFGIIDPVTGLDINDTNIASGLAATLRNGLGAPGSTAKVAGVCMEDTIRETRNNSYQYQRKIGAITVAKEGYYRIPFVIASTNHSAFGSIQTAGAVSTHGDYIGADGIGHVQFTATKDQAALIVDGPASLVTGAKIRVDKWGNPIITTAAGYVDTVPLGAKFTLTGFDFAVRMPMGNETMHYPGIEVASNQTGGIDYAIWALAKKIENSTLTVQQLRDLIIGSDSARWYGWATIRYEVE